MGLLKAAFFSLCLTFLVSCSKPEVRYMDTPCIMPMEGYHFETCRDFIFTVDDKVITVPQGFETDLASIPRFLWTFLPPQKANFIAPAIIHDYLYSCNHGYSREEIDAMLFDALKFEKESSFTAWKFYLGVRVGGMPFYTKELCYV